MYKKSAPTNKNVGPGDPPKKAKASNVLKKPSYALSQKIDKITGDTTSYEMIPGPKKWVNDDTFGRVQMSTLNSNRISNEEYKKRMKSSNTVAKMTGKAKAELDDMPIMDDEKNGAYVSGPLNMNAYQDKEASMDDYSHEKKLKADGRYEAAHGKMANAKNDFNHAHALKKDAHHDARHRHVIMKHMKSN